MSRAVHPGRPSERTLLTDPVRYPEAAQSGVRTKRAFLLLLLTLLLPGAAQVVAGDRRLGRRALRVTFTMWLLVIAGVVLAGLNRQLVVSLLANEWFSLLLIAVLVALAVGWALLFINTLRLIRPPLLDRGMRPAVAATLTKLHDARRTHPATFHPERRASDGYLTPEQFLERIERHEQSDEGDQHRLGRTAEGSRQAVGHPDRKQPAGCDRAARHRLLLRRAQIFS